MKNTKRKIGFSLLLIGLLIMGTYYFINQSIEYTRKNDGYLAYIPNVGDGTISVIDVSKQKLIDTIEVGEAVSHGIAITPDGLKLYTGDLDGGKIFVYDIKDKKIIKIINTSKRIHGIDITPDGKYVFLASGALKNNKKFNYIQIINTKTDEIIKTIKSKSKSPSHIDFTNDSKFAIISNVMSNDISIIDVEKGEITDTIKVGIMPNETELSKDNKFIYVANVQEGSLSIVDMNLKKETGKIKVSPGTHGIAVTNNGKHVWTTNRFGKNISIIDINKKKIIKTIETKGEPNHVSIVPESNYAYITNLQTDSLMIVDINTFEIIREIKTGKEPHEIEFVKIRQN